MLLLQQLYSQPIVSIIIVSILVLGIDVTAAKPSITTESSDNPFLTSSYYTTILKSKILSSSVTHGHRQHLRNTAMIHQNTTTTTATETNTVQPQRLIVVLDPDRVSNVTKKIQQIIEEYNFLKTDIPYVYDSIIFKGFVLSTSTSLQALRNDPDILLIEKDVTMKYGTTATTTSTTTPNNATNIPYHLDRLDGNQTVPYDGIYHKRIITNNNTTPVTIYVLDSGIRPTHVEFQKYTTTTTTRVSCGFDAVLGYESNVPCEDLHGHGTHIASMIAGTTIGVLPSGSSTSSKNNIMVHIKSVKVALQDLTFDGAAVLYGLQYILLEQLKNIHQPTIVNMSFGGPKFILLDFMVEALLSINVTIIAAAGNDGINSCQLSPAGNVGVVTVGASNYNDVIPYWSNYGNCVDIYAPGTNVIGASHINDTEYTTRTGTSYSTPIVSGVAALYLLLQPSLIPSQIFHLLVLDSYKNVLQSGPIPPPKKNTTTTSTKRTYKNRLVHTGVFTNDPPIRKYPTCPYTTKQKMNLCYKEGWLV